MHIKIRALVKGVSHKEWKGKSYDSIEVFGGGGVEGQPADIQVGVDIATQKALFDQADKIKPSMVDMVVDMSFFDRIARFHLVSLQGTAAK